MKVGMIKEGPKHWPWVKLMDKALPPGSLVVVREGPADEQVCFTDCGYGSDGAFFGTARPDWWINRLDIEILGDL